MKTIFNTTLLLFVAFLLIACSDNNDTDAPDIKPDSINISGFVHSPEGIALDSVEAYDAQGVLATSDDNGLFSFSIDVNKIANNSSRIRLRKPGYAAQTLVLQINENSANFNATLGKRNRSITVSADTDINIIGQSGARVSLSAGTLVDADGNAVSGDIQLSITAVDVSDDKQVGVFPGAFAGTDIDGNAAPVIMSYGTVEYLFTQNGNELNLAQGQSADIEIPVFVSTHPDGTTIQEGDQGALWYLNETTGLWIQENTGIVVVSAQSPTGLAFSASVTHFSWWNYDIAPDICDLSITPSGLPDNVSGTLYGRIPSPSLLASTTIDNQGVTVIVPRNVNVSLSSTVKASDGQYSASTNYTCNSATGNLTLEYTGPEEPTIVDFTATRKVYFQKASDDLWELDRIDGIFTWSVTGQTDLNLSSDQGHNTGLGSDQGSTQFPLDLNGSHAESYVFTLRASSEGGETTENLTLAYDDTPAPFANDIAIYIKGTIATIYWSSEGADTVSVGYVAKGGLPQNAVFIDSDIPAEAGVTLMDTSAINENSDIVIAFYNRYDTTYKQYNYLGCPPDLPSYDPVYGCNNGF